MISLSGTSVVGWCSNADTRRGRRTPDNLTQLRLRRRQQLESAMAFRQLYEFGCVIGLVPEILPHRSDDPHATRAHETANESDELLPLVSCQALVGEELFELVQHEYEARSFVLEHAAILPRSDR